MTSQTSVIHCDPEILGGVPVFVGTRVPLRNLIDYLEGGYSLDGLASGTAAHVNALMGN